MSFTKSLAVIVGAVFGTYFLVYPVFYFVYNWFIAQVGYPQYVIPGFWVGMAGYFLFNILRSMIRGFFKG